MGLSNAQLLMLDTLIYTDDVSEGKSVGEIIAKIEKDGYDSNACEMSSSEWKTLVVSIKNEPELLNYKVTNYVNDKSTGMRAACFVDDTSNPTDVNVVFRGTSGNYEWHDNGEGGYLSDTDQQQKAADYVNTLPENYGNDMTVTGHSKGGNKAQYVTIATDRIGKCISYDGQGFSEEFLEKYKNEIAEKSNRIVSIAASNDFVNCLLYSIAGTTIYIETEAQDKFKYNHKPNILLDEDGNLRQQTEQSVLSKLINEYTTYIISNVEEPERSFTIDGMIALLESGEDRESLFQRIYAGENALSHLDDFAFNYMQERVEEAVGYIAEAYGIPGKLAASCIAIVCYPYLFLDDFSKRKDALVEDIIMEMIKIAEPISKMVENVGGKAIELAKIFVNAVTTFAQKAGNWFNRKFNNGYKFASTHSYIRVNTNALWSYAERLYKVNLRIVKLDRRLDSLYSQVGWFDLWDLLQADALTGYSWRLNRCISYLKETAYEFEEAERSIASQV
jgi:hypothetical protein